MAIACSRDMSYRDATTLREKYVEQRKSGPELADEYGVSNRTIYNWLERHGIERRSRGNNRAGAGLATQHQGYRYWYSEHDGKCDRVRVHRLLAVAKYGFDAVCDMEVHHPNEVPWDNRPANIELREPGDHQREHALKRWERGGAEEFGRGD